MSLYCGLSYEEVVRRYAPAVHSVCVMRLSGHADADDCFQNVFLKLYRSKTDFTGPDHVKHWLLRVTINACKKAALSPWRRMEPIETCAEAFQMPSAEHAELLDAVMRLKPKYRTAIYLHYYEGCSTQEIAKLLGVPQNTVLTHLRRARQALKEELTEV